MNRVICLICWTGLLLAPSLTRGQVVFLDHSEASGAAGAALDVLQQWQLTLTPAAEPVPALKYSLWPRYGELTAGDATPHYYRALLMYVERSPLEQQYREKSERWLADEIRDETKQEMRAWLHEATLHELQVATYRERLDLDLRLRDLEGLETIQFLLPDAQAMRGLARMLQVKARLEIAEGRFADAVETLRVGYRLAQAAAKTPTLINDLVGIAIGGIMTQELTRLIAQPDAPNMYWAIASLPRPLIDLREAFGWESGVPLQIFTFLKDAETAERSPDEWRQVMLNSYENLHELTGNDVGKPGPLNQVAAAALMMKGYPIAKRDLIAQGLPREQVEAMPVGQVLAIHAARTHRYIYDESVKLTLLPPAQVYDRWPAVEQRLREQGYLGPEGWNQEALPISSILLPSVKNVWFAGLRLERELAAVQTIEAIRMHAAVDGGQLPESLDEIQVVVVPVDPLLGKPFSYRREGRQAILETTPRPGLEPPADARRYILTVRNPMP